MYYTYILKLANEQYYVGSTSDLQYRMKEHEEGRVFFTKPYRPLCLVYYEEFFTRKEAARREYQLKGWSRLKKEKLISGEWNKLSLS